MSPEIGVTYDEHGRVDLTCAPLPGENPKDYIDLATKISAAGFNLLRYVKNQRGRESQDYFDAAIAILVRYMPEDAAAEIAQAFIKRDTSTKAVIVFDSQGPVFKSIIKK